MYKGLGIGALIVSIVTIFSPSIGIYLTVLAALLAVFAFGLRRLHRGLKNY